VDLTRDLVERLGGELLLLDIAAEAYAETGEERQDRLWH
jgi:hypothetical protein